MSFKQKFVERGIVIKFHQALLKFQNVMKFFKKSYKIDRILNFFLIFFTLVEPLFALFESWRDN